MNEVVLLFLLTQPSPFLIVRVLFAMAVYRPKWIVFDLGISPNISYLLCLRGATGDTI